MDHPALLLDVAVGAEQASAEHGIAEALEGIGPDNQISDRGFVLHGNEHNTTGAAGTLPGGDRRNLGAQLQKLSELAHFLCDQNLALF